VTIHDRATHDGTTHDGDHVLIERVDDAGVCTLTFNRAEALNALSPSLFVQLRAHLEALAGDQPAACVVVRGRGRSFSAGNDLKALQSGDRPPYWTYQAETLDLLAALPIPVVAVVHGHCYTGALELALACDFIVCAESSMFADTHARWGMVPSWGMSQRLPQRVGTARAKQMMFTGRVFTGREAFEIGLVTDCVPDGELDGLVAQLTASITANSAHSNAANKRFVAVSAELGLTAGLEHERTQHPGPSPDMSVRLSSRYG
jgi:enoyl-CoA hydratase/carnithine racemase